MRFSLGSIALLAAALPAAAGAQPLVVADSGDSAWMLAASVLVLAGGFGFALLGARGGGRGAGVAPLVAGAIVALLFALFGYSLAFSDGNGIIGGPDNLLLSNLAELRGDDTISETLYAVYEMAVAMFGAAMLAAALAPRARFGWLVAFVPLWFVLVYLPVAHWMWGGGWLGDLGATDAAGGIVLGITAGMGTLVASILIGRRGDEGALATGESLPLGGLALVLAGALGVTGAAALGADEDAAGALLNLVLAVSAALVAGLGFDRLRRGTVTVEGAATAALAGFAAIASSAGAVAPGGAILIGLLGALAAAIASLAVASLRLGDGGAAFGAYAGGGAIGAVAFPVFVLPALGGPGFDDGVSVGGQIVAQVAAVGAVALWSAGLSAIAALMVAMVIPMRDKAAR